jgi:hypothetical protein
MKMSHIATSLVPNPHSTPATAAPALRPPHPIIPTGHSCRPPTSRFTPAPARRTLPAMRRHLPTPPNRTWTWTRLGRRLGVGLGLLATFTTLAASNPAADVPSPASATPTPWRHGPPTDPAWFPIGVWLQNPSQALRYKSRRHQPLRRPLERAHDKPNSTPWIVPACR